jgi:hypothetical protein
MPMLKRFLRWCRGLEFGYVDQATGKKKTVTLRGRKAEVAIIVFRLQQMEIEHLKAKLAAPEKK